MKDKTDVLQGTLALMVLKTLEVLGPLHGYGIADASSRSAATRSGSTRARCIPCC
jgi:hypothetical protein